MDRNALDAPACVSSIGPNFADPLDLIDMRPNRGRCCDSRTASNALAAAAARELQ